MNGGYLSVAIYFYLVMNTNRRNLNNLFLDNNFYVRDQFVGSDFLKNFRLQKPIFVGKSKMGWQKWADKFPFHTRFS